LAQLAITEGLAVHVPHRGSQLTADKADLLGIPYIVIVSENSLENGIVHMRDRDANWFEEVHVSHIMPRLVLVYHGLEAAKATDAKLQDMISQTQTQLNALKTKKYVRKRTKSVTEPAATNELDKAKRTQKAVAKANSASLGKEANKKSSQTVKKLKPDPSKMEKKVSKRSIKSGK
jgi:hypothetical protein